MSIKVLDASTVGRIAAGEVVERPASVVKELFENALDAGATAITVEIRGGGIEYLRVTDNGGGIAPGEVRLAFQNHATSKLRNADQLQDIRTLGFRGEALPSIASVSRITCTTRQKSAPSGVKLVLHGGEVKKLEDTGCPEGTTIIVEDLFFNTPVRRTFLKKPAYEAGVISETVARLLLGNPQVAVRFINQGKTVYHSFGDGNLRHSAMAVYGRETAQSLIPVEQSEGSIALSGLIGVGDCAKATRAHQAVFINGRVVRCPLFQQALENACQGRVTIGMHPMCMISIKLPPTAVDVNVHPNKLEVRFRDEAGVRMTLDSMFGRVFLEDRLLNLEKLTNTPVSQPTTLEIKKEFGSAADKQTEDGTDPKEKDQSLVSLSISDASTTSEIPHASVLSVKEGAALPIQPKHTISVFPEFLKERAGEPARDPVFQAPPKDIHQEELPFPPGAEEQASSVGSVIKQMQEAEQPAPADYRIIGVVFDTYILVETPQALLLIDQHAAHERILYEKLAPLLASGRASQQLLTPVVLSVTKKEMAQIEDQQELLQAAGFEVEPFGEQSIAVRAVPFILGKADMRPLFMEMLGKLDQLRYATEEKRRLELIQTACKHAVKGGDKLTDQEIIQLIRQMLDTRSPDTCPHGRPVVRSFTRTELEKLFKRLQ